MTPRLMAALGGVAVLATAAVGLYWKGRLEGAARERPKVEAARQLAAIAELETRGARESAERAEAAGRQQAAAVQSVIRITHEALKSEDAYAPLDSLRADRLRAHDEQLCQAAPSLAGCAATGDADRGAAAVRAAPPAGGPDPG